MSSQRKALLITLLLLLAFRGAVMFVRHSSFVDDPDAYRLIAVTLQQTGIYGVQFGDQPAKPTAFRPPLYPWLLSWLVRDGELRRMAVAMLHLVMIAITLLTTYAAGRRLVGHRVGLVAMSWVGIDPVLVQQSTLLMTETPAVMLTAVTTWLFILSVGANPIGVRQAAGRGHAATVRTEARPLLAVGLAFALALAFLCRPTFLVFAGLLILPVIFIAFRRPTRWWTVGTVSLVMALTVAGWTLRNAMVMGHPVWATTHGGYTVLLGNNRFFYDHLRSGSSWRSWDADAFTRAYVNRFDDPAIGDTWSIDAAAIPRLDRQSDEVAQDRWAAAVARQTIRQQPRSFAWSSLIRVMRLWSPLPVAVPQRSDRARYAIAAFYFFTYACAVIALIRCGRRFLSIEWWPVWSMVLTLTLVHSIYWSNLRMRAPAVPGLALVAATIVVRPAKRSP